MSGNYSFAFGSYINSSLYEVGQNAQEAASQTEESSSGQSTQVTTTPSYSDYNYNMYSNFTNLSNADFANAGSSVFNAYQNTLSNFNIDYSQPYRDILDDLYETWDNMANEDAVSGATNGNQAATEAAQAAMTHAESAQAALENVQAASNEVQQALDANDEEAAKGAATRALEEAQKAQEEAQAAQEEADAAKEAAKQAAQAAQEAVGTQSEEECARLAQEAQSVADTAQQAAQKAQEIADRAMEIATEAAQKADVDPSVVTEEDDGNTDEDEDDGNVETETGMENLTDEEKILVNDAVESILDATVRYMTGPFKLGTDEDMLFNIIGDENLTPELMQVVQTELEAKGYNLFDLIKSETSFETEDILVGGMLAKLGGKTTDGKVELESYGKYENLEKTDPEYQKYIRQCVSLFKQATGGWGFNKELFCYIMSLPEDMRQDVENMYNEKYGQEKDFETVGKQKSTSVIKAYFFNNN